VDLADVIKSIAEAQKEDESPELLIGEPDKID
jgi:hypothetical protein